MAPFCIDLVEKGFAVWNLEYRRIGEEGGGWPGTFHDVADGIDCLRILEKKYHLNLKQTLIIGFSSGGHLALWAASRYKIHKNSVLIRKNPISIHGVVSLAGVCDLKYFQNYDPECREIITKLVNYTHYDEACPTAFLPLNIKQILIGGDLDQDVPIETLKAYEKDAKRAGDIIEVHVVRDAGHFEFVVPGTDAHQKTVDEIRKFYR